MSNDERPYRFDSEYRAEVKAAGTDVLRLAQIEEHWLTQAELQARIEGLQVELRAKMASETMTKIYDTRAMSNPPPADTRGYKVGAEVTYKEVRPGVAHGENCHKAVADVALTRMTAARDEALAALERVVRSNLERVDLTPVDPDGPPSRRALQLAIAIMVWILGLALLAAHFAAGGAL